LFFKVQRLNQYLREEYHQLQDVLWKSESCSFKVQRLNQYLHEEKQLQDVLWKSEFSSFRFRGCTSTGICARNILSCKMFSRNQNLLLGSKAEPVSAGGISPAARCSLEIRILQTLRGHASQVLFFVQLPEVLEKR
jgi:hypothetical protein